MSDGAGRVNGHPSGPNSPLPFPPVTGIPAYEHSSSSPGPGPGPGPSPGSALNGFSRPNQYVGRIAFPGTNPNGGSRYNAQIPPARGGTLYRPPSW